MPSPDYDCETTPAGHTVTASDNGIVQRRAVPGAHGQGIEAAVDCSAALDGDVAQG